MSLYNQQWFPWQGGTAPTSSPLNHNRRYQYHVPSFAIDPLDAMKEQDIDQAGGEAHKPDSRSIRQELSTLGSASQSSLQSAEGNHSSADVFQHSCLHGAGTVPRQVTPEYLGASQSYDIANWSSHTGFQARPILMQPGAANQYSLSGSTYTALDHSTSVKISAPRALQERTLHRRSTSLKYGRQSRGALKLQRLALDPDIPYDSPADSNSLEIASSTSKAVATPSPSIEGESHMMNKVAKQRTCRPSRNHKADWAEKHYLETRDGQLYHKMGQETEWRKSTSRPTSTA